MITTYDFILENKILRPVPIVFLIFHYIWIFSQISQNFKFSTYGISEINEARIIIKMYVVKLKTNNTIFKIIIFRYFQPLV